MRFMMLITYTDLGDERPNVAVEFIDAATKDDAHRIAEELATDARRLMDATGSDWRDDENLVTLDGDQLVDEYGIAFGAVEVWAEEKLLHIAETPFGPRNLDPSDVAALRKAWQAAHQSTCGGQAAGPCGELPPPVPVAALPRSDPR